ncbi:diaminopimelate decarboxylase [Patescibacteria group bacterium]
MDVAKFFNEIVTNFGTPTYVYKQEIIEQQAKTLMENIRYEPKSLLYAIKANSNPAIIQLINSLGFGFDCVSCGEIFKVRKYAPTAPILFTPNNITDYEMFYADEKKASFNIGSLSRLEKFGKANVGSNICVRINTEFGAGHHPHCVTGGKDSKFGIWHADIPSIKEICEEYNLNVVGLHQHIGSGILDPDIFLQAMEPLMKIAYNFEGLDFINFGGGFGIPYKQIEFHLNMPELGKRISERFAKFCKEYGKELKLIFEPGRFLVGPAGCLLVKVNTIKKIPDGKTFVGVASGQTHLLRPALYRSYHKILNLSNPNGKEELCSVAGNICESGDILGDQILLPKVREGDILAIMDAGAYGFSMSSHYNSQPRPAEVMIGQNGSLKLIRPRETYEEAAERS